MRYVSTQLDLSRFKGFKLIDWSYANIKAESLASLRARFEAVGIPYNVEVLESDPSVILIEETSYREGLDLQAINDVGLGLTLAFATGTKLDLIGNTYFATERMVVTPADPVAGTAAVMESDDRYRRRVQLAPENFPGGGTPGGYVYSALTADPRVKDANVYIDAPGTGNVYVSILSTEGNGAVSPSLYSSVFKYIFSDTQKLATDVLHLVSATVTEYEVAANIVIPPGVAPEMVVAAATERMALEGAARHRIDMPVPVEAVASALHVSNAIRVDVSSPAHDINPGAAGAAYCTKITVTTSVYGENE